MTKNSWAIALIGVGFACVVASQILRSLNRARWQLSLPQTRSRQIQTLDEIGVTAMISGIVVAFCGK